MGNLFGGSKPEGTPIKGGGERICNLLMNQGRGIFGSLTFIIFLVLLLPADEMKKKPSKAVAATWFIMFAFLLIHPIKVPACSFFPIFLFPFLHVMNSAAVCIKIFSQNTAFLVIGGYLRDLLNVSGVDKRFTLWLLFSDNNASISNISLIVKSSFAAYLMSMVSNRDKVVVFIMNNVVKPLRRLEGGATEPDFSKMGCIVSNAVLTSSVIGSLSIVNGARTVMFMRIVWETSGHADTFNWLDYFCFAFPTCLLIFIINLIFNVAMVSMSIKNQMSSAKMTTFRSNVLAARDRLPKSISCHETLTILFSLIINVAYLSRFSFIIWKMADSYGWSGKAEPPGASSIPDASVAAIFLIITALVPIACTPMKICGANIQSDLPKVVKPDSSVLFWKIIDKSTNYGYMFLAGSFSVLDAAVVLTGSPTAYLHDAFSFIINMGLTGALFMVLLMSVVLSNIFTSIAASGMLTVLVLNFCPPTKTEIMLKQYQLALMTGMGTALGFCAKFKDTPFGAHNVRLKILSQLPYALGSIIVSAASLFVMVAFYAPVIFEINK